MAGYERTPSLVFTSGGRIERGWEAALARYRRSYPNPDAMGRLEFSGAPVCIPPFQVPEHGLGLLSDRIRERRDRGTHVGSRQRAVAFHDEMAIDAFSTRGHVSVGHHHHGDRDGGGEERALEKPDSHAEERRHWTADNSVMFRPRGRPGTFPFVPVSKLMQACGDCSQRVVRWQRICL